MEIQKTEVDLILSRAGIFETLNDIDDFTISPLIDQISVLVLGGFVVPLVDVECLKCKAMVKVGLSRFQKPIGELASVYHREYARRLENSYNLATYHLMQNYASR